MAEAQIKCDICNCTFARQEHLTRHARSHTREKPYQCLQCNKSFSRLDVLQRHISSHEQSASDLAGVSTRACRECAASRVRCSKGSPCRRCGAKSLECTYPVQRKRKASADHRDADPIGLREPAPQLRGPRPSSQHDAENSTMDPNVPPISDQILTSTINLATNAGFPQEPTSMTFRSVDTNNLALGRGFSEPVLGMSALNWLSPQYQDVPEWDSQLIATSGNGMAMGDFEFALSFSQAGLPPDTSPQDHPSRTQRPLVEDGPWILPEQQGGELLGKSPSVSTKSSTSSRDSRVTEGRFYVWAIADQFKARLALVHAGAVLWYVRRHSVHGFMEPFAVYAATLCLWVYSVSTVSTVSTVHQQEPRARPSNGAPDSSERVDSISTGVESDEGPELYFIYLDRPCDDEMVQTYVRLGHKMSANLLRVGNICSAGAPRKILQEGVRLLSGEGRRASRLAQSPANEWGISNSFRAILQSLIQVAPVEGASSGEK